MPAMMQTGGHVAPGLNFAKFVPKFGGRFHEEISAKFGGGFGGFREISVRSGFRSISRNLAISFLAKTKFCDFIFGRPSGDLHFIPYTGTGRTLHGKSSQPATSL